MTFSGNRRRSWPLDQGKPTQHWAWKTIPLAEVIDERRRRPEHEGNTGGDPADGPQRVPSSMTGAVRVESLEQLDSVIHDFLACLGQVHVQAPADGSGSAKIARLTRILEEAPPAGSPMLGSPVFCGMSPSIGLESLFGFLGSLRKTGILRIRTDETTSMISIVQGDVVHGVSHPRPERELLGNILLGLGTIEPYELNGFFYKYGSSAGGIGEALNREELVARTELREALEIQLQLLFDRVLASRTSEWCFHEGEVTLSFINLLLNATRVLLQSARKRDEESSR